MNLPDIQAYNNLQSTEEKAICEKLLSLFLHELPNAEFKIWHAHPVWFIDGNPIVGYNKLKTGIRVLFWSGQSFDENLSVEGKFKAAEIRYTSLGDIDEAKLRRCLQKAVKIQWDYKHLIQRKGVLEKLTTF